MRSSLPCATDFTHRNLPFPDVPTDYFCPGSILPSRADVADGGAPHYGCAAVGPLAAISWSRSTALIALLCQGRHVPPLIAVFEPAGAAVVLQRATEVVRPDCQPKFSREIFEDFLGTSALSVRLHGHQSCLAQRWAPYLVATSRSRLRTGRRRGFRGASFSPLLGSNPLPAESAQSAFGDFQLIELIAQLCPFRIEPHESFGNPPFVLSDLVQHSHLLRSP
jgi:hypothetical protein